MGFHKISGQLILLILSVALIVTATTSFNEDGIRQDVSLTTPAKIFSQIPGLYDENQLPMLTPIQGESHFERVVLKGEGKAMNQAQSSNRSKAVLDQLSAVERSPNELAYASQQRINLVQFYMATCPDCQGFSPYFKRLAKDIGGHWSRLISVSVINCNDEANLRVCWDQNPTLIVPLVRWYTFPAILQDVREQKLAHRDGQTNRSASLISTNERPFKNSFLNFPKELLNVAHRAYNEKQRRDLISMRHATLRYISTILEQLARPADQNQPGGTIRSARDFYLSLPMRWRLMRPIGRPEERKQPERFVEDLNERLSGCVRENDLPINSTVIHNFLLLERPNSYVGKTLVADWSNWTCSAETSANQSEANRRLLMIHYSSDFSILDKIVVGEPKVNWSSEEMRLAEPLLFYFSASKPISSFAELPISLLSSNGSAPERTSKNPAEPLVRKARLVSSQRARPPSISQSSPSPARIIAKSEPEYSSSILERVNQRKSLERFYTRRRSLDWAQRHPVHQHYRAQTPAIDPNSTLLGRRRTRRAPIGELEAENINWAPEQLYPGEEALRWRFNQAIGGIVFGETGKALNGGAIFPGFAEGNQGEIRKNSTVNANSVIAAKEEDLTGLKLTDYYKVLAEMIHKNVLSKAELDGYQLAATTCLLRQLVRHFPFQGGSSSSVVRHYLDLMQGRFAKLLNEHLAPVHQFEGCQASLSSLGNESSVSQRMRQLRVTSKQLEQIQAGLRTNHSVGLPAESHFKWAYCRGSSEYLRGHTCSLWVLFHTLTVHEYLAGQSKRIAPNSDSDSNSKLSSPVDVEPQPELEPYKFVINYSNSSPPLMASVGEAGEQLFGRQLCDPRAPESALLNSSTEDLFINEPQFALSNVINFVRYYLACTNCAAHFSCMVQRALHSGNLNLRSPKRPDEHLLWLWEAHNRVNLRTKGTHSEDPIHPKHVFPAYEACPQCYLERPAREMSSPEQLDRLKFNRAKLVEFLVARYRQSAIVNNKIRIEDLFRKE